MAKQAYFKPALFRFLRELADNNEREWFQAHKARYEDDVRQPMLRFIADFGPHLKKISPAYVADPSPNGGSLFRIYRDVRFSKDKSPYKTAAGAHFRHEAGKDVHAPGFYLNMEPGRVFAGVGIWQPDARALGRIRDALVREGARWQRIKASKALQTTHELTGDKLSRPPKGYDPAHPLIEDLKFKDFTTVTKLKEQDACADDFMARFTEICRAGAPFNQFLTEALGLRW
ncbi:MAG: DUF2461 domain-containing protein [Candidatus Lambdaproteobacteria bacterium]|nr:DUF2461 domain-containing protein [Candidatus Lambdaproteobacteria bacterium]